MHLSFDGLHRTFQIFPYLTSATQMLRNLTYFVLALTKWSFFLKSIKSIFLTLNLPNQFQKKDNRQYHNDQHVGVRYSTFSIKSKVLFELGSNHVLKGA
jgi:hypothetical protein